MNRSIISSKITFFLCLVLAIGLSLSIEGCQESMPQTPSGPLFNELSPEQTGVLFSNTLSPDVSTKFNLLDFDYYYNGAGVGVGDINNDGLQDLFFAANEVGNKLYLNKGDLNFEDISAEAHINVGKHWSTGVSMIDINQDGWLDIYVSQGGPHTSDERHNLLYINNQDLTFTESAREYGLDDSGISTQAAFFDFDKDGDLDCIVINESLLYGYEPTTFHRLLLENEEQVYESYSHFYRNDEGSYVDATIDAGITAPTFGLGLVVSDINDDGWLDIYIANDYYQPDNVYINKKNGSFFDRSKIHLKQSSFFSMGADIADINNDGHQDIFVLDMASKDHVRAKTLMASMDTKSFDLLVNKFGFLHQYMFNSLQLNDGNGRFNNIAQMAGVANTDWSWASIIEDFDNDGYRDIFVTNGYRQYGTDNDFKSKVTAAKKQYNNNVPLDVKRELYQSMPSEPMANKMYANHGNLKFSEMGKEWGFGTPTFSNGAATADLDNDGDLDIVINNMDAPAGIYENTADKRAQHFLNVQIKGEESSFAKVEIKYGDLSQIAEIKVVRGYMSSLQSIAHFGLGEEDMVDEVVVTFSDGKQWSKSNVKSNQTLKVNSKNGNDPKSKPRKIKSSINLIPPAAVGLDFTHKDNQYDDFKTEILLPYKQSTRGAVFAKADLNNDGIDDLYVGAPSGQASRLYVSNESGYTELPQSSFADHMKYEDVAAAFFDFEKDGDLDILVLGGGNDHPLGDEHYHPRLYINDGSNNYAKSRYDLSDFAGAGGDIAILDYDGDGDEDVLIANRIIPQKYPVAAPSYLLRNDVGRLVDVTVDIAPMLSEAGIINDVSVVDIDGDGDQDLAIAAEWESPMILVNDNGQFSELSGGMDDFSGMYFSVTPTDVNGDGRIDLVYGNIGENYKLNASKKEPLRIYAGDFDANGTHDLVLTKTYKGEYVPVRGRECSSQQMPFILDKFETYDDFANSSLQDIYGAEELENAYAKLITTRASLVLINQGRDLKPVLLPNDVQAFPLLSVISEDLNDDGLDDLICVGSIYDMEVETPRLDGGTGLVLLSTESSGYQIDREGGYDFYIGGEVKSMIPIDGPNDTKYGLISRNNNTSALITYK